LALELRVADTTESAHRETCIAILLHTFSEANAGDTFQADINTTWYKTPLNKACHSLIIDITFQADINIVEFLVIYKQNLIIFNKNLFEGLL
jgi:hypothetical protein